MDCHYAHYKVSYLCYSALRKHTVCCQGQKGVPGVPLWHTIPPGGTARVAQQRAWAGATAWTGSRTRFRDAEDYASSVLRVPDDKFIGTMLRLRTVWSYPRQGRYQVSGPWQVAKFSPAWCRNGRQDAGCCTGRRHRRFLPKPRLLTWQTDWHTGLRTLDFI